MRRTTSKKRPTKHLPQHRVRLPQVVCGRVVALCDTCGHLVEVKSARAGR